MHDAELATALRRAYEGAPIEPIGAQFADVKAAYGVQEINTRYWLDQGRRLTGRKIGLTAKSVQQQLGVDQPDYGMLFEDMRLAIGEPLQTHELLQPKVEAEVAFVMKAPLDEPDVSVVELMDSIAYMLPALEIVDSRIRDWKIGLNDTVADNASAAKYLIGARPVSLDAVSLAEIQMILTNNGERVSQGVGGDCLGHPLNAVLWLARTMAALGRPLRKHDIVLSGALGPMIDLKSGDRFKCRIDGFETLRLDVE